MTNKADLNDDLGSVIRAACCTRKARFVRETVSRQDHGEVAMDRRVSFSDSFLQVLRNAGFIKAHEMGHHFRWASGDGKVDSFRDIS